MLRVCLFHAKADEAEATLALLRGAGYAVIHQDKYAAEALRACRQSPPDVIVIDLSRLPSQGLEIAIALRHSPATKAVPIIFCGGVEEKVHKVRTHLPDAAYCAPPDLALCVERALKTARHEVVTPVPMMERYASRTAAEKLGIKRDSVVALIEAPRNFRDLLAPLPIGVSFCEPEDDTAGVTLLFIHDCDALRSALSEFRFRAARTKLWILWRKKTSRDHDGVTEPLVRQTGIALGLVDYKICSVDRTWSGMLFALKGKASRTRSN